MAIRPQLSTGDVLNCGHDRRLVALRPGDTDRLQRFIRGAAQTSAGDPGSSGGTLRLSRRSDEAAVLTVVAPVPHNSDGVAAVLLHMDERTPGADALTVLYDLTPAEAAVAVLIGRGCTLAEAASERGVSLGTVQGQMKALLRKRGARSQSDFVRVTMQRQVALR